MARSVEAVAAEARKFLLDKTAECVTKHLGASNEAKSLLSDINANIFTAFSAVFSGSSAPLFGDDPDEDGPVVF